MKLRWLKEFASLTRYVLRQDSRHSLLLWMRQQGGVTRFFNLQFHIEDSIDRKCYDSQEAYLKKTEPAEIAITMQGPIVGKNDFTLNTCRIYKMLYPNVAIIVSSWSDESPDIIESLRENGVEVVVSDRPTQAKLPINVVFQYILNEAALKEARRQGKKYIFKSRCDQRMINPTFIVGFDYYCHLISNAPRLTFSLHNSIYNAVYKINDQFMYGPLEEIALFWQMDEKLCTRVINSIKEASLEVSPEAIFMMAYLYRRLGAHIECENEVYRNTVSRLCSFSEVGSEMMYWHKYPVRFMPSWSSQKRSWRQWNWFEWHNRATSGDERD